MSRPPSRLVPLGTVDSFEAARPATHLNESTVARTAGFETQPISGGLAWGEPLPALRNLATPRIENRKVLFVLVRKAERTVAKMLDFSIEESRQTPFRPHFSDARRVSRSKPPQRAARQNQASRLDGTPAWPFAKRGRTESP